MKKIQSEATMQDAERGTNGPESDHNDKSSDSLTHLHHKDASESDERIP